MIIHIHILILGIISEWLIAKQLMSGYPLVNEHNYGKSPFLIGILPFSIAMLVYQRVIIVNIVLVM